LLQSLVNILSFGTRQNLGTVHGDAVEHQYGIIS